MRLVITNIILFLFQGYSRLGAALSYMGKEMEALDAYQEGLKHDPNNQQLKTSCNELEEKLSKNFCCYPEVIADMFLIFHCFTVRLCLKKNYIIYNIIIQTAPLSINKIELYNTYMLILLLWVRIFNHSKYTKQNWLFGVLKSGQIFLNLI